MSLIPQTIWDSKLSAHTLGSGINQNYFNHLHNFNIGIAREQSRNRQFASGNYYRGIHIFEEKALFFTNHPRIPVSRFACR